MTIVLDENVSCDLLYWLNFDYIEMAYCDTFMSVPYLIYEAAISHFHKKRTIAIRK